VLRHRGRQLDHAEEIRVRSGNEALDGGEVSVADFDVCFDQPKLACGRCARSGRQGWRSRSSQNRDVHGREHHSNRREPRPAQQKPHDCRGSEDDQVLEAEDIGRLEDPPHAIEKSEQRRQSDQRDDDRHEHAQRVNHGSTLYSPSPSAATRVFALGLREPALDALDPMRVTRVIAEELRRLVPS
jgi:hypothetical protein